MTDITSKEIEAQVNETEINEEELTEVSGGVSVSMRAAVQDSMVSSFKRGFTRDFVVAREPANKSKGFGRHN